MAILSRRKFLQQGATLIAAGWAVPSFIAETARIMDRGVRFAPPAEAAARRILVIVQLAGGNDGLNTLIPYGDSTYYSMRPSLAIARSSVLPLTDYVGLHPSLTRIKARYDAGMVAIPQGISYPNPNRSHFRGTDIWETAVPDRVEPSGWVGRYLQACGCQRSDHLEAMAAGMTKVPRTFWTEMALVPAVSSISSFRYFSVNNSSTTQRNSEIQTLRNGLAQADGQPEAEFLRQSILTALTDSDILAGAGNTPTVGAYPTNSFGNAMKMVAQLVVADVGTSIFYVSLGGFDTHSSQLGTQASLLSTFDQAIDAFLVDMNQAARLNDVAIMTFSEFGRRGAGNASGGTDHGVAAPHFLIGGLVKGGLYASYPSLTDLESGDLKMQLDFRSFYATVLERWLNIASSSILGGAFSTLDMFRLSCSPRANVGVSAAALGPDRLQATVTAGTGSLQSLRFGAATNALIDIGSQVGMSGNFSVALPASTTQTTFIVRRAGPGAATVPFTVVDACGDWPTFVGGGDAAWGAGTVTTGGTTARQSPSTAPLVTASPTTTVSSPPETLSLPSTPTGRRRRGRHKRRR